MSDDYKNGYREGFLDGFKSARDNPYMTQPVVPETPYINLPKTYQTTPPWNGCDVCKMPFTKPWGYVCARSNCPTRVTC